MIDVAELLDALDFTVARAEAVLPAEDFAETAAAARAVRRREGFLGGTLLIALAGGTGSGKSSVLNALAGSAVASVSPVRPHTDEALAWIPADAEPNLGTLLEGYGIGRHVLQREFPGLAVIDLPDHDSIVVDHRATVASLLPVVDAIVWVLDPEKYRDPILYEDYLARMRGHGRQFVFVLNQIDRIAGNVDAVAADMRAALRNVGLEAVELFPTAADPDRGPQAGVDSLAAHLRDRLDAKLVSLGKLVADVRSIADTVAAQAGLESGASLDFDRRWSEVRSAAVAGLRAGTDPAARADTLCRVEDFVVALSVEAGGVVGRRTRAAFSPEAIGRHLAEIGDETGSAVPEPRGRGRRRGREDGSAAMAAALDGRIAVPLRDLLWDRAVLGAALAGLGVELARAEAALAAGEV